MKVLIFAYQRLLGQRAGMQQDLMYRGKESVVSGAFTEFRGLINGI